MDAILDTKQINIPTPGYSFFALDRVKENRTKIVSSDVFDVIVVLSR